MNHPNLSKTLVLRLSSLGDVILASGVLECESLLSGVDWVVATEFASVLQGHPKIHRLWKFDRAPKDLKSKRALGRLTRFFVWTRLCRELWSSHYSHVIDLHGSLRTRILYFLFCYWSLVQKKPMPVWTQVDKARWRRSGYFIFKNAWPKKWRPRSRILDFVRAVGGKGTEKPSLRHLQFQAVGRPDHFSFLVPFSSPYLCVMPDASRKGKRWSVEGYVEALKDSPLLPVILGTEKDTESVKLVRLLRQRSIPHFSGVGNWDLSRVACVLAQARVYLGGDTGLAHLAEAMGIPAVILFGPTVPDLGFGPWRPESHSLGISLWCRPCGKDGRFCFRPIRRHQCLRLLEPKQVVSLIRHYYPPA